MSRPLDGILVISVEQAIAAPYCTRQLADLGARVIKIERPDGGDFARSYDTRVRGLSSHFVWTNRSKESVTLDLTRPDEVAILKALVSQADVFVQNLAPGAAARLGLAADVLRPANQRLITCSISGYGAGGPHEKRKAYDLLVQAEAGLLCVTGTASEMVKAGIPVADIAAGTAAFQGILAVLIHRGRTGVGDHVEISMLEALAEWMGFPMYFAYGGAPPPPRSGAGHATIYPYGLFATRDGAVLFGVQNDREWNTFSIAVLRRPDWAGDARFSGSQARMAHRDTIGPAIDAVLSRLGTDEALGLLESAGIATARVNDIAGLWAHEQLAARNRWSKIETPAGPVPALSPLSGDGWTPRMDKVPALGEHTSAVLEEFGLPLPSRLAG